ncbi:MAG: HEAT repeat domain-containing protein [Spirochaetota bacterium]
MKAKVVLISLIILSLLLSAVFAQDNRKDTKEPVREPTVEELYLKNAEVKTINEMAKTLDRDMKGIALQNISDMISQGKVSTGAPDVHYILDYLAIEGTMRQVWENRKLINNYIEIRKDACRLLGDVGGENSKNSLLYVVLHDDEPMVLSEAVYALGKIGLNDNNEVSTAIAQTIRSLDIRGPDMNFAYASLLALEKIAAKNNGITDENAMNALVMLRSFKYNSIIRNKADEVRKKLMSYQSK